MCLVRRAAAAHRQVRRRVKCVWMCALVGGGGARVNRVPRSASKHRIPGPVAEPRDNHAFHISQTGRLPGYPHIPGMQTGMHCASTIGTP